MSNLSIQIFVEDLLETFEYYKRAFNATQLFIANGSEDEVIHLEMDIMGNMIALAPHLASEIIKGK